MKSKVKGVGGGWSKFREKWMEYTKKGVKKNNEMVKKNDQQVQNYIEKKTSKLDK